MKLKLNAQGLTDNKINLNTLEIQIKDTIYN